MRAEKYGKGDFRQTVKKPGMVCVYSIHKALSPCKEKLQEPLDQPATELASFSSAAVDGTLQLYMDDVLPACMSTSWCPRRPEEQIGSCLS